MTTSDPASILAVTIVTGFLVMCTITAHVVRLNNKKLDLANDHWSDDEAITSPLRNGRRGQ